MHLIAVFQQTLKTKEETNVTTNYLSNMDSAVRLDAVVQIGETCKAREWSNSSQ